MTEINKKKDYNEIERKYYDGSYCPKCLSSDYNYDYNDHETSCDHLELVVSSICNECGCEFYTQLVHGSGSVETNVYHFETLIGKI